MTIYVDAKGAIALLESGEWELGSLVRLRKPQTCVAGGLLDGVHTIEPGMVAKKESAKVDGEFGTCYHCLPCLGRLMAMEKGR